MQFSLAHRSCAFAIVALCAVGCTAPAGGASAAPIVPAATIAPSAAPATPSASPAPPAGGEYGDEHGDEYGDEYATPAP